jgi:hypothetical protein
MTKEVQNKFELRPEPEKKGVMICLDCGHKTEASDTDIHELLSLDVVHTPCHRAEKANRGRMVRVTDPLEESGCAHGSSGVEGVKPNKRLGFYSRFPGYSSN